MAELELNSICLVHLGARAQSAAETIACLQYHCAMAELELLLEEFPQEQSSATMVRLQEHLQQLCWQQQSSTEAPRGSHASARSLVEGAGIARGFRGAILLGVAVRALQRWQIG